MRRPPLPRRSRRGPGPEAQLERRVIAVYEAAGFKVYRLSQGYRPEPGGTRQTPGIADLECWHPGRGILLKHEVKTPKGEQEHQRMLRAKVGELTPAKLRRLKRAQCQAAYADLCHRCHIPYARGGVDAAIALLGSLGLLETR